MAPAPDDMMEASMSPVRLTVKQQFGCCTLQSLGPVHCVNTPPAGHEAAARQAALAPVAIGAASPWPSENLALAQQLCMVAGQSSGPSHITSAPPSPQVPGVTQLDMVPPMPGFTQHTWGALQVM